MAAAVAVKQPVAIRPVEPAAHYKVVILLLKVTEVVAEAAALATLAEAVEPVTVPDLAAEVAAAILPAT
jgi:hypothetical protein